MKNKFLYCSLVCFGIFLSKISPGQTNVFPASGAAGIGTTTPNASSLLDLTSTSKGVLFPRMTKVERDAIVSPGAGLIIYQTNNTPGLYYYDGGWTAVTPMNANKSLSNLTAPTAVNLELLPGTDNSFNLGSSAFSWKDGYFDGDIYLDGNRFVSNANHLSNTLVGTGAGNSLTPIFTDNSFLGYRAGYSNAANFNTAVGSQALYSNTSGQTNSVLGYNALYMNATGSNNCAMGYKTLYYNTASNNTAIGFQSQFSNTSGTGNVSNGYKALYSNTTGYNNTAIGSSALYFNTMGYSNTALGNLALYSNTTGIDNNAIGYHTLYSNTNGFGNVAVGNEALYSNTTGYSNVALGYDALHWSTTGDDNIALGNSALYSSAGYGNIGIGLAALENTTSDANTAIGYMAARDYEQTNSTFLGSYTGNSVTGLTNTTVIGYSAHGTSSNQVRIGNSSVTSIGGYVNWSNLSDGRFKKNIKENVPGLEFINALKPITYTLDINGISKFLGEDVTVRNKQASAVDQQGKDEKSKIIYTGFIAQDVEAAANKIDYDFSGVDKPQNESSLYGLRYAEFVVPLVKAVQELDGKERSDVEELKAENEELKSRIEKLESIITHSDTLSDLIIKSQGADKSPAQLGQNIPNPFDNSTIIPFHIPTDCFDASIMIINTSTSQVVRMIQVSCNDDHVSINAGAIPGGTYSYALYVNGKMVETKQMVIQK
jgi:hypothetical protein